MRVTFLLPVANLRGGTRVVAVYASMLRERGHTVTVLSRRPARQPLRARVKSLATGRWPGWGAPKPPPSHLDDLGLDWHIVEHDGPLTDDDLPDADVAVATWWETAAWLADLRPSTGARVYFCQGYDTHTGLPIDRVLETYRLPMLQVCVSRWVAEQIEGATGRGGQIIVPNGVDHARFDGSERSKRADRCRIGFMYSDAQIKGIDLAIRALEQAREARPTLEAVCFSAKPPCDRVPLPGWIACDVAPSQAAIASLYASCDAWLVPSRHEGFGLPLLEAMASRTPIIATPAGAAPELLSGGGGIPIVHEDVDGLTGAILEIEGMTTDAWEAMSSRAYQTSQSYTWQRSSDLFERALQQAADRSEQTSALQGTAR
ncbi:MAG: glycosyltransferase family 4 protein [Planctomycetota bacterium]